MTRSVWVHQSAIGVEVDRAYMQGLTFIADEVGQQQKRFLLIFYRKWRWRWLALKNLNAGIYGMDDVMVVGAGRGGDVAAPPSRSRWVKRSAGHRARETAIRGSRRTGC